MGKTTGFLEYSRELPAKESVNERIKHNHEFVLDKEFGAKIYEQTARCMNCGVPFCHNGCPLGNIIPEFNDAVYNKEWKLAWEILSETNNFPEFTGRVCPAPCEFSCVLGINQDPVTICNIEKHIIETAFEKGYVDATKPKTQSGKSVAVVGSGPAGLACAEQLNKAGHSVTVFECDEKAGGLLRFGIPDFKLGSDVIDRRIKFMQESGIGIKTGIKIGVDLSVHDLRKSYDALVLTGGSKVPRNLPIKGREFKGVHFAMDFLAQQNRRVNNLLSDDVDEILATDLNVVVIGGGDTGSDCVGTSNRHGAKTIKQIEIMPKPGTHRPESQPWPTYPNVLKTSTSHEEGCEREWNVQTKEFIGDENGKLQALKVVDVEWYKNEEGAFTFKELPSTERLIPCQLALLAMGFVHPEKEGMIEQLEVELDERGNVKTSAFQTSENGVFAAGDMRTGQSLVVRCINDGRRCAEAVDKFLK